MHMRISKPYCGSKSCRPGRYPPPQTSSAIGDIMLTSYFFVLMTLWTLCTFAHTFLHLQSFVFIILQPLLQKQGVWVSNAYNPSRSLQPLFALLGHGILVPI